MANIFTRSPYIIQINEASQVGTKVELFISSGTDSTPSDPTYTISKLIPASNKPQTEYNISPYIREFMNFNSIVSAYDDGYMNVNTFARVVVKRYKDIGAGYVLIDSNTYFCFDGYGYYEEGANPNLVRSLMTEGTYYYHYDSTIDLATDFDDVPSSIGVPLNGFDSEGYRATYTNLVTGASVSSSISNSIVGGGTYNFPRQFKTVKEAYYSDGNKLEIIDTNTSTLLATYYFYPKPKCKYEPIRCDFINKFGQYQRLWFYAASNDTINIKGSEHKKLQSSITSYNTIEGQSKEFNLNGKKSIRVNTDWVNEDFKDILKEIMLSEKVLIDGYPCKLKTKSTELFKHINTKMINYALEFEFNYNVINNVI